MQRQHKIEQGMHYRFQWINLTDPHLEQYTLEMQKWAMIYSGT